ncbi:hypothetical protein BH09BAC1_BH09BAC1_09090 [soil metagenome]
MNKLKIFYWVVTVLLSVFLLGSGIGDLTYAAPIAQGFGHLGMPLYLLPFFGVLKILGVIAILVPQLSRLREGAYAGSLFYAIGAVYVHLANGDPAGEAAGATVMLILVLASYLTSLKVRQVAMY